MILTENISKLYKLEGVEVHALRGINMTVAKGDFLSVIGPSGSGKSTLMNIIGCLDTPTAGCYLLNGHEVSSLSDNRLAEIRNQLIGFVFQSFNLLPRLSALENVELPLIYRGMGGRERQETALSALENVGLGDRIGHRPTQLSGGQQQRVAIARALVGNPPLILADEPTGNLDSTSGKEVMTLLQKLHSEGKTIVLITHDMDIAMQSQRYVRIHDGEIVEEKVVPS
ncbi:MAG: ABC transporter ATP-binding protein [Firmicutes bacterium]|nr:ABC transporter ATP-binding protein [Bacillota bacterium]